jgi:GNAT superfamily N-acetyltransferase
MAVVVESVRGTRGVQDFLEVGPRLNAGDAIYSPPLREDLGRALSDENPLWREGRGEREMFVAYDSGKAVGRVLGHVHHASNVRHGEKVGFFGLLECGGELEIGRALIEAVASGHRGRGLTSLRGPYELTITQCMGAVVAGFDEAASFSQSWNGPWLPPVLEALGFVPTMRMTTFRLDDLGSVDPEALIGEKQRAVLARSDVRIRTFDMSRFEADLGEAVRLLNAAFVDNYGFVALSPEEVAFMAGPMKRVVRPELTTIVELAGTPVAVAVMMPDFNVLFRRMGGSLWPLGWARFLAGARTLDAAVAQFIATDPAHRNQGLIRIALAEALRQLKRAGFRTLDGTWISDSNGPSRAQVLAMGMREKHRLALYARPL